jgi:aminoglycoside phosphotransferase (APT) family kinase protein
VNRADAALVGRDRALPGLARLLDADRFAAELDASLRRCGSDAVVGGAQLVYLRYKPETSCLAAFELDLDGRTAFVHAKAHAAHDGDKYAKARERLGRHDGALGVPGVAWDDVQVVVRGFPNDLVLARLPKLTTTPERRRRFLQRLAPHRPELWDAHLHVLKYKAERRFVARLDVGARPQALLKLYGADDFERARAGVRSVADVGGVGVPRLIGASRSAGALLISWHDGTVLHASERDLAAASVAARAAGAALRGLHGRDRGGPQGSSDTRHPRAVVAAAEAVAFLVPELATRVRRVASEATAAIAAASARHVSLHGDFSSDQVVVGPAGDVAIIDFDEATTGPAAIDLGSFLAQLARDRTLGRLTPERADVSGGALIDGYGAAPEALGACVAAGLVRLAPHVFRERDEAWPERTEAVVAAAERALGRPQPSLAGSVAT